MPSSRTIVHLVVAALSISAAARADESFVGTLTGATANPSTASTAIGSVAMLYSESAHQLRVELSYTGLTAPATASHIHCCAARPTNVGVALTFVGFPLQTSGAYVHLFDLTSVATYSAGFLTSSGGTAAGAEAALRAGLTAGTAYVNLHSAAFPAGEIRAYPVPGLSLDGFEGGDVTAWSGVCGERWVNETGLPSEAEICALLVPPALGGPIGLPIPPIVGELLEPGITDLYGSSPLVRAQLGIGPFTSDPRTSCSWRWTRGEWFSEGGGYDIYRVFTIVPPQAGTYSYVFRFTFDGSSWTACDLDAAGSYPGLIFDPVHGGVLTASP